MSSPKPETKEAPDVTLIGIQQLGFEGATTEDEIRKRTIQMLARALNIRRVIGFIGSGISKPYGYLGWDDFAKELVDFTLKSETGLNLDETIRNYLESYSKGADSRLARADRTLLVLGVCEETFERAGRRDEFRRKIKDLMRPPANQRYQPDPLRTIIDKLEIRRFLTTNYDLEIEKAFQRILGSPPGPLGLDPGPPATRTEFNGPVARSLMLDPEHPEVLIQFAVAAPGYERGVFHLHGRSDQESSMIVTERDYQRMYLQDDPLHRAYREALNLAFSGNPILFLGFGMEEADLLRPLRQFVSERPRDTRERPLFVLYPEFGKAEDATEFRRYLHARFGVKVLYFRSTDSSTMTEDLCTEIKNLSDKWRVWWKGWQTKPVVRKPEFFQPSQSNTMVHHYSDPKDLFDLSDDVAKVRKTLSKGASVIVIGRPGTGKGSLGLQLATENQTNPPQYKRRFFATAHFTNDLLSTIDAAAEFLGNGNLKENSDPLDRLEQALMSGKHLLVIGGFERLLAPVSPGEYPDIYHVDGGEYPLPLGHPITREVARLLNIVAGISDQKQSHVIITTSILPISLRGTSVRRVVLQGVPVEALQQRTPFQTLWNRDNGKLVREFQYALRGHAYALSLAGHALEGMEEDSKRAAWLGQVIARLTAVGLPRRAEQTAEAALQHALESSGEPMGNLRDVLQRIAMFTTPVTPSTIAASGSLESEPEKLQKTVEQLVQRNLVIPIRGPEHEERRYTAHTVVRTNILHVLGGLPDSPGEPQRFDLSGFSTEAAEIQPGTATGHALTTRSFDTLISGLESRGNFDKYRDQLRAAFGLIRFRWTATGIGRLAALLPETILGLKRPHYEAYQRRLARLLNAIRAGSSEGDGWLMDCEPRSGIEKSSGILYVDELAWLYNELGLVSFCQGSMHDAYALFRAGQDVNAVAERRTHGHRWCQSEMNLATVQIERARLYRARFHLDNAIRAAGNIGDEEMQWRARGYMGLVHHLSGEYDLAEELYGKAVEKLRSTGNRRAVSIFMRHRGDLMRRRGQIKEAWLDISGSIAAAESGRHPDLLHYARIAEANLKLSAKDFTALQALGPALEFARTIGIPKLEADAYKVQGHIALEQGEIDLAGRLAISCLGIASALGMRLRLTAALVLLGRVAQARGDMGAARGIFRSAIELGEREGYQLQIEDAEQQLMQTSSARS